MAELRIVVDSTTDISQECRDEYPVYSIPVPIRIDGVLYGEAIRDDRKIYEAIREGKKVEALPMKKDVYYMHFKKFAEERHKVLYLAYSSGTVDVLEEVFQAKERLEREYKGFSLTVLDTKCVSFGNGLLAETLLKMQKNGAPEELILQAAQELNRKVVQLFLPKSLSALRRAGLISNRDMFCDRLFRHEAVVCINPSGRFTIAAKAKNSSQAVTFCIDRLKAEGKLKSYQIIGICHGDNPSCERQIKSRMLEQLTGRKLKESRGGCELGIYLGPGVVGIFSLSVEREDYLAWLN